MAIQIAKRAAAKIEPSRGVMAPRARGRRRQRVTWRSYSMSRRSFQAMAALRAMKAERRRCTLRWKRWRGAVRVGDRMAPKRVPKRKG